jgi:uncharacterized protein
MQECIMLTCIMKFVNREAELRRLDALTRADEGGLAVVYGRRRIGKTRLLVEWCRRHGGIYAVADQSAPDVQRRYLAETIATRFAGFADVEYRDWRALLGRLATEARAASWHGPLVFDELPYWITTSPELASVLQRWIDHEARAAKLAVAFAGSSQRMMQGLALDRGAPLYGRAKELFEVLPLELGHMAEAFGRFSSRTLVEHYAAWGGVPRYWELAEPRIRDLISAIDEIILDPRGPLHREPDRLLLEEIPSALEVRPVLDAIGAGAHRVSEIASRIGRPATSLSRPLERLIELGLAVREVPFGESPRASRRSLYRIADPFTRLWFRVVAPHRAELVSGTARSRRALLARYWDGLVSTTWEQLCRHAVPAMSHRLLGEPGTWKPVSRWWGGNAAEWDLVAEDIAGQRLLLGEVKLGATDVRARAAELLRRAPPELPAKYRGHERVYAVFVPDSRVGAVGAAAVVTARDLMG